LPRRPHHPLACIATELLRKNNGENSFCFDDFTVCLLTFFLIKLLFLGYRAIRDIAAHRWIFAMPLRPSVLVYYIRAATQKNGENLLCFDNFSVILLPFFQLNCYFWANAQSAISQLTQQRCKKNGEEVL
jgi:hypothetical protein